MKGSPTKSKSSPTTSKGTIEQTSIASIAPPKETSGIIPSKEGSESGEEQDEILPQGNSEVHIRKNSIDLSSNENKKSEASNIEDESIFNPSTMKDGWDTDSSIESDKKLFQVVDKAIDQTVTGKDWEDDYDSDEASKLSIRKGLRLRRVAARNSRKSGKGRKGKGYVGGLDNRLPSKAEAISSDDNEWLSKPPSKRNDKVTGKAEAGTPEDYIGRVENGVKRRKSMHHTDDTIMHDEEDWDAKEPDEHENVKDMQDQAPDPTDDESLKAEDTREEDRKGYKGILDSDQDDDAADDEEDEADASNNMDVQVNKNEDDKEDSEKERDDEDAAKESDNDDDAKERDDEDLANESDDEATVAQDEPKEGDVDTAVSNADPLYDANWLFEFKLKSKVDQFKIDAIMGCLATALRSVDSTACIASWNNLSQETIWSVATVPKTDEEMMNFVEDPHTSKVGIHGRLYGRLRILSSMTLAEFKQNQDFGNWIRAEGLFLDISEIPCTRPKMLGFFDRKLPHASRIDIFKGFLQSTMNISKPYQIYSQTINAGDGTGLKCHAYVLKADFKDAEIILQDIARSQATSSTKFYVWEDYRDHTELVDKRKFISEMTAYARNHASFIFSGIVANDYMRLKSTKGSAPVDKNKLSSLQSAQLALETQKDTLY